MVVLIFVLGHTGFYTGFTSLCRSFLKDVRRFDVSFLAWLGFCLGFLPSITGFRRLLACKKGGAGPAIGSMAASQRKKGPPLRRGVASRWSITAPFDSAAGVPSQISPRRPSSLIRLSPLDRRSTNRRKRRRPLGPPHSRSLSHRIVPHPKTR